MISILSGFFNKEGQKGLEDRPHGVQFLSLYDA